MDENNRFWTKLIFGILFVFAFVTTVIGGIKVAGVGDIGGLLNSLAPGLVLAANENSCIITLFGKQYDVTTLRTTHSGGDVFSCGTDATTSYQSRHGTDVGRMQPYLVVAPSPTAVPTAVPTAMPVVTSTPIPTNKPTATPSPDLLPTITTTSTPTVKPGSLPIKITPPFNGRYKYDSDDEIEVKCDGKKHVIKIMWEHGYDEDEDEKEDEEDDEND